MDTSTKEGREARRYQMEKAKVATLMSKWHKSKKLAVAGMIQNITGLGDFDDSHFSN